MLGASSVISHAQRRDEGFLRYGHISILSHPLLALLLLLEELAFAGGVAAVAFGGDVLAHGADRLAGDDLAADRRLDRDLEQVARDQLLQALAHAAAPRLGGAAVDDHAQGVDRLLVDEDAHLDEVALAIADLLIIEARIALRNAFQPVVEIEH